MFAADSGLGDGESDPAALSLASKFLEESEERNEFQNLSQVKHTA